MEMIKRTFSLRKKKKPSLEQEAAEWLGDERRVADGLCCFRVKYLGWIQVYEATGMRICEEASAILRHNAKKVETLSFRKRVKRTKQKGHSPTPIIVQLHIAGDFLTLLEDRKEFENLPVAQRVYRMEVVIRQSVEKVSFCAPDRNYSKGFALICRDCVNKRWMCHAFTTFDDTGDRLSHAVGCAFAVCLETKKKREKQNVAVKYSADKTSFQRDGSFRRASLTERRADPQSVKIVEPVGLLCERSASTTFLPSSSHIERPRPSPYTLVRQESSSEFSKLNSSSSAFKRNTSLRLSELPSTLRRQAADAAGVDTTTLGTLEPSGKEAVCGDEAAGAAFDPIAVMCQQLTTGLCNLQDCGVKDLKLSTSSSQEKAFQDTPVRILPKPPVRSLPKPSDSWSCNPAPTTLLDPITSGTTSGAAGTTSGATGTTSGAVVAAHFQSPKPANPSMTGYPIPSTNPFLPSAHTSSAAEFVLKI